MFTPQFREAVCEAFLVNDFDTLEALVEPLRSDGPWVIGRAGSLLAGAPYELVAIDLNGLVLNPLIAEASSIQKSGLNRCFYRNLLIKRDPNRATRQD